MSWRIALVLETSGTGSGRHTLDLAQGLDQAGNAVHVFYSGRRAEPRFVDTLRSNARITAHRVDMRRAPHPNDLWALHTLRRQFGAFGPFDVVHGHSSKGILGCIAATGSGAARIFTPHALKSLDPTLSGAARLACGAIETTATRFADAVIAVSPAEGEHARRIGVPDSKLHTIINGLARTETVDRAGARLEIGLAPDDVCIGFVGRMVSQKAPFRLLQVFTELARRISDVRLVMVGDGPLRTDLVQRAEQAGLSDRVIWLPDADGPKIIPGFDIFALPSRYEAMPYVLLEAAAAGLPIVVTDVGGAKVAVDHERNGFIIRNWDDAAFAEALARLAGNSELRSAMGAASLSRAGAFTVDRMLDETMQVYRATSDSKSKHRGLPVNGGPPVLPTTPKDVNG